MSADSLLDAAPGRVGVLVKGPDGPPTMAIALRPRVTVEPVTITNPVDAPATSAIRLSPPSPQPTGADGADEVDVAEPLPGHGPGHLAWNGRERRSQAGVARLTREFDALVTTAVDPVEIVAGLEASGLNDAMAQEYRSRDLFDLAERMFGLTPRLADRLPGRLANPWAERPLRHLLRGVSYALPGLIFVAVAPTVAGRAGLIALVVALMIGWPMSQCLAYLGYTLDGQRHPLGARALLLVGLGFALVVAGVYWQVAGLLHLDGVLAGVGAGEIVYLSAAGVLTVVGGEALAFAVLAPGLLAAALAVAWAPARVMVPWGAGLSVLAAVGAAFAACRAARWTHLTGARRALSRHEVVETGFHAGYGVTGALLVSLPALADHGGHYAALSLLPLTWSMGMAEWSVVRLRRSAFDLLNSAITLFDFERRARTLADEAATRYLVSLSLLSATVGGWLVLRDHGLPAPETLWGVTSGWLLGVVFYAALVLSSLGRMRSVVRVLLVAGAVGLLSLAVPLAPAVVLAPSIAAVLLVPMLRGSLGDPTSHM